MSSTIQHKIHPDAETLNAFTEQALNAKERGEVFAHLAECGRCRQIVALSREAAGAKVAATRHGDARRRTWWNSWGLALAPVAAFAAVAVIAFYIHERNMEQPAEVAQLEQQQANEKAPMPPQAPPPSPAQAAPSTPKPPNDGPAKSRNTDQAATPPHTPAAEPVETAAAPPTPSPVAPPAESIGGPISSHEEYRESHAAELHGTMPDSYAPSGPPPDYKTQLEAALRDEERTKHAEEAKEDRHLRAAEASPPSSPLGPKNGDADSGAAGSGTAGNTEQVDADAQQQIQTQPAPEARTGSLMGRNLSGFSAAHMPRPTRLPSGLPALSIAFADHRSLAIDEKGTLFFSEDAGLNWEKVKRQWTGRAVMVRRKLEDDSNKEPLPADETQKTASESNTLSRTETIFELFNEQGDVWLSADGRTWNPK